MAGKPIKPRISLDDLAEFVADYSPASGGTSWEDAAQTIVYDVPFKYVYDAYLLLLGFAYTEDVACEKNGDPTAPIPPGNPVQPTTFTARVTSGSNFIDQISDYSGLAVGSQLYLKTSGTFTGTVVTLYGNNDTVDTTFRALQLDDFPSNYGASGTTTFTIGRPWGAANIEKRKFLRRLLPAAHPVFPYMVCTRIDNWQGVGPRGKATSLSRLPLSTVIKNVPTYTSVYKTLRINATYTMPKYKVDVDPKYGDEIVRYFWREQSPSANLITLDKGTMVFAEGGIGVLGKTFTAPGYGQPEVMQNFSYYWSHVPEDYFNTETTYTANGIAITDIGLPIRFVQALQCVNQTEFLGFKPGTLLMEPYEYERFRMPLEFTDVIPRFWVRMKINLKYFNPEYITNGENPRQHFGHLTAPVGMNGYAFFVTTNTATGVSKPRFPSYDFNSLFYPLMENERTATV